MNVAKIAVWVELANLAVLAVIVLAVTNRPSSVAAQTDMPTAYNVTKTFRVDKTELSMTANSTEAEEYWLSFTQGKNNGLVSVPMKWAEEQGLNSSGLPTAEGETVFQVDAFHQLHCLVSLHRCFFYLSTTTISLTAADLDQATDTQRHHHRPCPSPAQP